MARGFSVLIVHKSPTKWIFLKKITNVWAPPSDSDPTGLEQGPGRCIFFFQVPPGDSNLQPPMKTTSLQALPDHIYLSGPERWIDKPSTARKGAAQLKTQIRRHVQYVEVGRQRTPMKEKTIERLGNEGSRHLRISTMHSPWLLRDGEVKVRPSCFSIQVISKTPSHLRSPFLIREEGAF